MDKMGFRITATPWKVLLLITLIGGLLRVHGITSYGLWGDEQASMQCATGQRYVVDTIHTFTNIQLRSTDNLRGVLRSTVNDNGNSVLYNVVLHYWLRLFGRSDLAARSLSLLAGIIIILVAFRFSKALTGNLNAAYFTAAFVAFHPLLVGYSQEARAYSMALLFSLLSSLFLMEGMFRKNGWAKFFSLYAATLIAALLSHYLVVYVLGAQLVIAAIWLKGERKWWVLGGNFFGVLVVMGLWFLVGGTEGLTVLQDQNQAHVLQAEAYMPGDPPYALPVNTRNIATGMVQTWLHVFGNRIQDMGYRIREIGVLLLIPLLLVAFLIVAKWKRSREGFRPLFILFVFIAAQALFAVTASVRAGHCLSFLPQYALFVIPYAMVLLGWSVSEIVGPRVRSRSIGVIAFLAYGLVCMLGLKVTYSNPLGKFPGKNEALEAAHVIEARYIPGDTVLVRSAMEARSINLYLTGKAPIIQRIDPSLPEMISLNKLR